MTLFSTVKKPFRAPKVEAEIETGSGALGQGNGQDVGPADVEKGKATGNLGEHSPSGSSEAMAENPKSSEPSADDEKKRSTGKTVLLMIALCV